METKELNREIWLFGFRILLKTSFPNWILKSWVPVSSLMAQEVGLKSLHCSQPGPPWCWQTEFPSFYFLTRKDDCFPFAVYKFHLLCYTAHSNESCCRLVCPIQGVRPHLQCNSTHSKKAGRWTPGLVCQGTTESQEIVPVNVVTILGAEQTPETTTLQSSIHYISLSIREIKSSEK